MESVQRALFTANLKPARRSSPMHINSPFFVVPVIIVVFLVCIFFGTSSKEDGHHENGH
jgi:hypothetical protein